MKNKQSRPSVFQGAGKLSDNYPARPPEGGSAGKGQAYVVGGVNTGLRKTKVILSTQLFKGVTDSCGQLSCLRDF